MSSRRNGGEGQEVRRETLTRGEELLHRTAEESMVKTRPAGVAPFSTADHVLPRAGWEYPLQVRLAPVRLPLRVANLLL
jgi:hypothetical protein